MRARSLNAACVLPVLLGTALLSSTHLLADDPAVLSIEEIDPNGVSHSVTTGSHVSDINSVLVLHLDKDALRSRLAGLGVVSVPDEMVQRFKALERALADQDKALDQLQVAIDAWRKWTSTASPDDFVRFRDALGRSASPARDILTIFPLIPEVEALTDAELADPVIVDRAVYAGAAREVRRLGVEIDGLAQAAGVAIQFGGQLDTGDGPHPLHLGPFDDYPEAEPYDVPRWNLSLPDDLDRYVALADKVNKKQGAALGTIGREWLSELVASSATRTCLESLGKSFDKKRAQAGLQAAAIKSELDGVVADANDLASYWDGLKVRYGPGATTTTNATEFLEGTWRDVQAIVDKFRDTKDRLTAHAKAIDAAAQGVSGEVQSDLKALAAEAKHCVTITEAEIAAFGNVLLFKTATPFTDAASDVADKLKSFDIASLPTDYRFALRNTGRREIGDDIVFVVRVISPQGKENLREEHRMFLFMPLWHLDMKAGLVFADPSGPNELRKKFQAAPAYHILFKKHRREHIGWNRVFDPGFGATVAALDFNHDDALELGLGVVVSALRDLFQLGYGYNVTEAQSFWYFGIRLPLPSTTVPLQGKGAKN